MGVESYIFPMRNTIRFIVVALSLCFGVAAYAQTAQSSTLVIDETSLEAVNADAVTGLALDPIGKDRSNRACARIKLHVNRMTPEEIAELEVRTIGGNVLVMKQQVAYEGNGLIITRDVNGVFGSNSVTSINKAASDKSSIVDLLASGERIVNRVHNPDGGIVNKSVVNGITDSTTKVISSDNDIFINEKY